MLQFEIYYDDGSDSDDGLELRRLENARIITIGFVTIVRSFYNYLKHYFWIFMYPFIVLVENPLKYLFRRIQHAFPYLFDHLWLLADFMVFYLPIFITFSASFFSFA